MGEIIVIVFLLALIFIMALQKKSATRIELDSRFESLEKEIKSKDQRIDDLYHLLAQSMANHKAS